MQERLLIWAKIILLSFIGPNVRLEKLTGQFSFLAWFEEKGMSVASI
jgi:hypothetical protein